MKIMKTSAIIAVMSLLLGFSSCSTPKNIRYFQDTYMFPEMTVDNAEKIKAKSGDKLSIIVNSSDPTLTYQFNLVQADNRIGSTSSLGGIASNTSSSGMTVAYSIDDDGKIDFPVLGKVHVAGFNRFEIASNIKNLLIQKRLVTDPIVTVEFVNLYYSILGEVNKPGAYSINHDQVTIIDAISLAGDLTILGEREDITVLREENGVRKTYHVNITSIDNVYSSPVYFLQQKDIVYVAPNDQRMRQSTVNGNNVRNASFWMSTVSFAATMAVLIVNLFK